MSDTRHPADDDCRRPAVRDDTRGGYPAGDKPVSQLRPPPRSITRRRTAVPGSR